MVKKLNPREVETNNTDIIQAGLEQRSAYYSICSFLHITLFQV